LVKTFLDRNILRPGEALGELLIRPFQTFAATEVAGGILLLSTTLLAMFWINSSFGDLYDAWLKAPIGMMIGSTFFKRSLHFWVNEGLMTIFFFVVGLEIKREVISGELASWRQAALPVVAALGGMILPAACYFTLNRGGPAASGWGIPMGTDIAFTLAALRLLGSRVPPSLSIFVVALAIADDLGAVMVISIFYTAKISAAYLLLSGIIFLCMAVVNILGFRSLLPYLVLGFLLWLSIYLSGVHSTVAGVLAAMAIPARTRYDTDAFLADARRVMERFRCAGKCGFSTFTNPDHQDAVRSLEAMCRRVEPPLHRIEYSLHPWVAFLIVPLFALANAGLRVEWSSMGKIFGDPVSLGIVLGLFFGKQIGITAAAWLAVRSGLAIMPEGVRWSQVYGAAVLCGIGFTMSLFIADLAFSGPEFLDPAKIGTFAGSLISFAVGVGILSLVAGETHKTAGAAKPSE
jgi:NhaA family Na+:H+ antiporter